MYYSLRLVIRPHNGVSCPTFFNSTSSQLCRRNNQTSGPFRPHVDGQRSVSSIIQLGVPRLRNKRNDKEKGESDVDFGGYSNAMVEGSKCRMDSWDRDFVCEDDSLCSAFSVRLGWNRFADHCRHELDLNDKTLRPIVLRCWIGVTVSELPWLLTKIVSKGCLSMSISAFGPVPYSSHLFHTYRHLSIYSVDTRYK